MGTQRDISELYRRYGPLLYSRFRRTLKDEEAAAEATVKAFRDLLQRGVIHDAQKVVKYLQTLVN